MKILIQYHERLGDILRMLPLAKYLNEKGNEVLFQCKDEYHGIFECISYAKPVRIDEEIGGFDFIFNRQIWPNLYQEYRGSGKKWEQFVFGEYFPDAVGKRIVLDRLPEAINDSGYNVVAPFGISQVNRIDPTLVIKKALQMYGIEKLIILCPEPNLAKNLLVGMGYHCSSVAEMASLIKNAKNFLGINSSPAVIASAVRDSYDWIPDGSFNGQDDYGLGANTICL